MSGAAKSELRDVVFGGAMFFGFMLVAQEESGWVAVVLVMLGMAGAVFALRGGWSLLRRVLW